MTVPIEPGEASESTDDEDPAPELTWVVPPILPLTVIALFAGMIWLIGVVVPRVHENSQRTGEQALELMRALKK